MGFGFLLSGWWSWGSSEWLVAAAGVEGEVAEGLIDPRPRHPVGGYHVSDAAPSISIAVMTKRALTPVNPSRWVWPHPGHLSGMS
jgi:hypothetical protein